jgi:signal transduction histidine kinase
LEQVLLPIISSIPVELSLKVEVDVIEDRDVMTHLRAVVREAVSNAVRHSHCSHITLTVRRANPAHLEVAVIDNGVGVPANVGRRSGLANIEDRARELGGQARLEPNPAGGTQMYWVVPIPEWTP